MKEKVFAIVATLMKVPVESVNEDSSPESIETWDSLTHMNLIMALEQQLGVQFTDDEIVEMITVDLILKTIAKKSKS
jgi:acyl carrier protein